VFATRVEGQPDKSRFSGGGVRVVGIHADLSPGRRAYEPGHPDADPEGYVEYPNVNVVTEMVDLITATRAYEQISLSSILRGIWHSKPWKSSWLRVKMVFIGA